MVSGRACQLFTLLGAAGVGKSRLAAEFLASLGEAVVVRGRCLPYGEGITYWPVVEVVKRLPEVDLDPIAAETIAAVAGDGQVVTSTEEIAWSFRKLLEAVAAERPLVCVFDDVHWGEETFLDLVEHVADLSRDAPILLLCMARPDLLDRRAAWAGGKVNATTVLLEPLGPEETERLIESLAHLDDGLRARIREAAEGNPLFVEEMVAMVGESPDRDVSVPPTIQALLAARLDQLDASERSVIERGSVEGRVFHRGAVQALAPEEQHVTARLTSLVRKELVRPDKAQLPGEDAFRFRHLLIRDAAYDGLPKATRADLHERFAAWLEEHGAGLAELEEIVGYHLERAVQYRTELGTPEDVLAERAATRLATAGRRAELRGDLNAAVNLLERALRLRGDVDYDVELVLDLGEDLFWSGRLTEAEALLRDAVARTGAHDDRCAALLAQLAYQGVLSFTAPETSTERGQLAERAIPVFEAAGDERGLMEAWAAIGQTEHVLCRFRKRNEAILCAIEHARRSGHERAVRHFTALLAPGYVFGPAPVEEGLAWYATEEVERLGRPSLVGSRAMLTAMRGDFAEARRLLDEARGRGEELGERIVIGHLGEFTWAVETRAGEPLAAVRALRQACELFEQIGERGWLSTLTGELGHVLCDLGEFDEAEDWARKSRQLGGSDDIVTQMYWRQVLARVRAHRGEYDEAESAAREAIALGESTDMLSPRGLAHLDLAEVLEAAGRREEAAAEIERALGLFEQKGDLPMVDQARARLQRLL